MRSKSLLIPVAVLVLQLFVVPAVVAQNSSKSTSSNVTVHSRTQFAAAVRSAGPGTTILLAPGIYTNPDGDWTLVLDGLNGRSDGWITVTALDPGNPPILRGDRVGLHASNASYLKIRGMRVEDMLDIGIHIAGANPPSYAALSDTHHIIIEDCTIIDTGKRDWGNHDGIKISGTDYFNVRRVAIDGWGFGGGSAIDIVGAQYGVIEDSTFTFSSTAWSGNMFSTDGITMKGGARGILVQGNYLHGAGVNPIQIGQDSGIQWLRDPPGTVLSDGTVMNYEARKIEVAGNRINAAVYDGSALIVPFMWMKSDQSTAHHNTVVVVSNPAHGTGRGIATIAGSENDGLRRARNGAISRNIIVYKYASLRNWYQPFINADFNDPILQTFRFAGNAWHQLDSDEAGLHLPNTTGPNGLPSADPDAVYQVDPQFAIDLHTAATSSIRAADLVVRSSDVRLRDKGADAYLRLMLTAPQKGESFSAFPIRLAGILDDDAPLRSLVLSIDGSNRVDITGAVRNGAFSHDITSMTPGDHELIVEADYVPLPAAEPLQRSARSTVAITYRPRLDAPNAPANLRELPRNQDTKAR